MLFINTIILAIVQALTEFLPISSSGHLVILHSWLPLEGIDSLTLDISLHVGTLMALVLFFRHDIWKYLKAFGQMFRGPNLSHDDQRTVVNIVLATIPAVLAGLFLEKYIEDAVRTIPIVAAALIGGGILLLIVEKASKQKLLYEGLSMPEAFIIGCAQAVALIPGVSRSGATIVAGMALHLKRSEAARFSFLLSIPAVLAAAAKQMWDMRHMTIPTQEWQVIGIGIVVSAVLGYGVIKFFIQFVSKYPLSVFAWYRILLGAALLLLIAL